jgi:glycopeptide antibiotics resistance protein
MIADPQQLERIQTVTREYSRFSQTALGLAWIPFAVLLPLCWRLSASLEPRLMGLVMVLSFGIWFLIRELLRNRLYQRFGAVQETRVETTLDFWSGITLGLLLGFVLAIAFKQIGWLKVPWLDQIDPRFLVLLPGAIIGFGRLQKRDLTSTIVLFLLTVCTINGRYLSEVFTYQQILQVLCVVGICGYVIFRGIQEHQQFKSLETQLESLRP